MAWATIIGSGPNGLSAAVSLARAGYDVRVLEAASTIGGSLRTAELTLPGFRHDIGSAVHPAAMASPFFRAFGLDERIQWLRSEIAYAHPLDGDRAAIAWNDLELTASGLAADGGTWHSLLAPLSGRIEQLVEMTGSSLLPMPRHPLMALRFGLRMLNHGTPLARRAFRTEEAAALLAGVLAHANTPLPSLPGAAAGLLLAAHAHAGGWGLPRGGAQAIADALADDIRVHGGTIETGVPVRDLGALDWGDPARGDLLLLNTSPRLLLTHPGAPSGYARALRRYRYGPAAAKVDFALEAPIPWTNPLLAQTPTVHLGGTHAEVWASENAVAAGRVSERPFVLAAQPGVIDETRAPAGKGVLWTYIHVPHGSPLDATELVTRQVERFAPGFRDVVLASHAVAASEREALNPSDIGGDILAGAFTLGQAVRRPVLSHAPWRTPLRGVYLASAATPPGPGVHGMGGWHAARTALRDAGEPASLADLFGG